MSTMNIAIIGGVVLLILVLAKMRRSQAAETTPSGRGRVRGERRRKRGKDTPPAAPEPMPLAAAAGQSAATATPESMGPPAAEWPPADAPAPGEWAPAAEDSPVEWPPVEEHAAPRDSEGQDDDGPAADPDAPAHHDPFSEEPHAPWAEDELVTDPGWPMPGEVDVAWSPPPGHEAMGAAPPVVQPVASEPTWSDEIAAGAAPASVEWLSAEPAEDEAQEWSPAEAAPEAVWAPAPEAVEPSDEVLSWGAAADAAAGAEAVWDTAGQAAGQDGPWGDQVPQAHDSQPTGPIPAVRITDDAPADEPRDAVEEPGFAYPDDAYAAPGPEVQYAPEPEVQYAPEPPEAVYAAEPEVQYSPEPSEAVYAPEPDLPSDLPGYAAEEPPAHEPYSAGEDAGWPTGGYEASVHPDDAPAQEPVASFDEPVAFPEPVVPFDEPVAFPEPVLVEAPEAPSAPATAWWDEEPAAPAVVAAAPRQDDPAFTGRFALGGFAMQPGQHSLGGVSFRVELDAPPSDWTVGGSIDDDAPAGTLVLVLDGAINCAPQGLEVVMDPGFAPTTQGFTVRASALAAGPFAASGTFRVR